MKIGGSSNVLRDIQAGLLAEQQRSWQRLLAIPFVAKLALQTLVGSTPRDVVLEQGTWKLVRYRRQSPALHAEPVLLCYALINRPYILDLQPDKSVVARYLAAGFEVYMIDWGEPTDADHVLGLDDYVCGFLARAVDHIRHAHGRDSVHLLGYCMGGTMSTLYTALEPERIKSLTLLAAPIDFSGRESLLQEWTNPDHFDVDAFIDAHGNCPAWFLQSCFLAMKPVQNLIEKGIALYEQLDDSRVVTSFFALERWVNDNIPVAGETFRQFVKKLYQANQLVKGELELRGRRVDLGRITCPLLLLTAKNDHLVAPSATEGIRPHVGSKDIKSMTIDAGHVGLVVGGKAQKVVWPEATRWMAERSTPMGNANAAEVVS
jgi:polyhydroxyalkanoate synthase